MSKIIYICHRHSSRLVLKNADIQLICKQLTPDNIEPALPLVINNNGIQVIITPPSTSLPAKDTCICMGNMFSPANNWWEPGGGIPDGTYALFRNDTNTVEILTDAVASRTVWYLKTDDFFIASSSQRAIVMLTKQFDLNKKVIPWMISSGTLGPGLSWDDRINMLSANSTLTLNRTTWESTVNQSSFEYQATKMSARQHKQALNDSIEQTFKQLDIDLDKWILPLSGGVDSRAIFLMLKDRPALKTVTWGLASSRLNKVSDAVIAEQLANRFKVSHQYFDTDISTESIDAIFDRFLVAGEGRVDNISGYMDGFRIWKTLHDSGVNGIIRGDEAFGCLKVNNEAEVFSNMQLQTLEDFDNLDPFMRQFGQMDQQIPENLLRKSNESLEQWRDRLNKEFEFPVILSALNDLKLPFVEIVNPLISHPVIDQVMKLPDALRTDKKLFTMLVRDLCPSIRFAKHAAIESRNSILQREDVTDMIQNELHSGHAKQLFDEAIINDVLSETIPSNSSNSVFSRIKDSPLSRKVIRNFSPCRKRNIDMNIVALRLFLTSKMTKMLYHDATILRPLD